MIWTNTKRIRVKLINLVTWYPMLVQSIRKWDILACKMIDRRKLTMQLQSEWKRTLKSLLLRSEMKNKNKPTTINREFKISQHPKSTIMFKWISKNSIRRSNYWKWRIKLSSSNKNKMSKFMKRNCRRQIMRTLYWLSSWKKRTRKLSLMTSKSKSLKRRFQTRGWDH